MKLRFLLKSLSALTILCLSASASAQTTVIHDFAGSVKIKQGDKQPFNATKEKSLGFNDKIIIKDGAWVQIRENFGNKRIYKCETPGTYTILQIKNSGERQQVNHAGGIIKIAFNDKSRTQKTNTTTVPGVTRHALSAYDPDAAAVVMDPQSVALSLCNADLTDTIQGLPVEYIGGANDTNMMFKITNTFSSPIYLNVFKIDTAEKTIAVSNLGNPLGNYALPPAEELIRISPTVEKEGEKTYVVMTCYPFDVEAALALANQMLQTGIADEQRHPVEAVYTWPLVKISEP